MSNDERIQISAGLDELQRKVEANEELTLEQRVYTARQIEYLRDASERLGRKDWLMLALGTISNLMVGVARTAAYAVRTGGAAGR